MKRLSIVLALVVALLMAVNFVSAQDPTAEPDAANPSDDRPRGGDRVGVVLDAVSAATGLERAEIVRLATEEGKTLAEIVTENGGDAAAVQADIIAQLTEESTSRIEQNIADVMNNPLPERGDRRGGDRDGGRDGGRRDGFFGDRLDNPLVREVIRYITDNSDLQLDEIRTQAEAGAPISEIATAAGIDMAAMTTAIETEAAEHIAEDVADGRITQEEADERLANLSDLLDTALNTPLPELQRQARFMAGVNRAVLESAAAALSVEPRELRQGLNEGDTLAAYITAQAGDVAAITAAAKTAVEEQVAQAVTDGNLTQEEADLLLADLDSSIETVLNREVKAPRRR